MARAAVANEAQSNEAADSKIFFYGYGAGPSSVPEARFRKALSGNPELTQPVQWGFRKSLYFCYVIHNFSGSYESKAVKYIVDRYIRNYAFEEKVIAIETSCDQSVDIFVIDGYHVDFLKSGRKQGQSYTDYNIKSAQRFYSSLAFYGLFAAYDKSLLEKVSNVLSKKENEIPKNNENARDRLEKFAQENSKEKIYYINFGNPKDEMRICKILKFNEDSSPIYGLANTLGGVYDKNNRFKIRQKLSAEFKDLDSFWRSVNLNDNGSYTNRGKSPCNIFIDYAYNTNIVLKALEANGSKFSFADFKSVEMSAKYHKFESVTDYELALQIGASHSEYDRLKGHSVFNHDSFLSAAGEMNRLGYYDGQHIRDVLSYLDDKLEGKALGRSAVWVRNKRDKQEAAETRSAELEYKNCLNANGYYRTKNSTAKNAIEKKCS